MKKTIQTYLMAFGHPFTYNVWRNHYLWFGFLWGIPIPVFSIALDLTLGAAPGRTPLGAVIDHPVHLFFLAHPVLFALVFGAMGTVRHALEIHNAELIQSLTDLATTDALTNLPNRRYVLGELTKALQRSRRMEQPFALVLFDLDGFKGVNDTLGHAAGDVVLKKAAEALRSVTREGDTLGRYGGDEFLLLTFGDLQSTQSLVARAREAVHLATRLGLSAGVARSPEDAKTEEGMIESADRDLAAVKEKVYAEKRTTRRGTEARKSALNGE
jgi:diguanylate cyclase (GGDEF)-like protein